jgi:hypothetical protein
VICSWEGAGVMACMVAYCREDREYLQQRREAAFDGGGIRGGI